jgi:hypothetical protein
VTAALAHRDESILGKQRADLFGGQDAQPTQRRPPTG